MAQTRGRRYAKRRRSPLKTVVILLLVLAVSGGAVYLDSGAECVTEVVKRLILLDLKPSELFKDNKTRLQEVLQSGGGNCPSYELLAESGPDHAKQFEMGVYLNGELIGKGKGNSKKRAAQAAAADALSRIEVK